MGDADVLVKILSGLPATVHTLRLVGLGLGPNGWAQPCLAAACRGRSQLHLDLSRNSLNDRDIEAALPLLVRTEAVPDGSPCTPILTGLNLSGNPGITAASLQKFFVTSGAAAAGLQELDLSECSLGND